MNTEDTIFTVISCTSFTTHYLSLNLLISQFQKKWIFGNHKQIWQKNSQKKNYEKVIWEKGF
jgi:hypothetical protein